MKCLGRWTLYGVLVTLCFLSVVNTSKSQPMNPQFHLLYPQYNCNTLYWWTSDFTGVVQSWFRPTQGTPDYYHNCNLDPQYEVPKNLHCGTSPRHATLPDANYTGSLDSSLMAYAGIVIMDRTNAPGADIHTREYISVPLQSTLIVGNTYTIRYQVRAAYPAGLYGEKAHIKRLGVLLTQNPVVPANTVTPNTQTAIDVTIGDYNYLDHPTGFWHDLYWQTVTIPITITSTNKDYLTIGNFDANIPSTSFDPSEPSSGEYTRKAYYLIDDVEILDSNANANCCDFRFDVARSGITDFNCCYTLSFHTGDSACTIYGFRIKESDGTVLNITDLISNPILPSTDNRQINVCLDSTTTEQMLIVEFLDENGDVICEKVGLFDCRCACEGINLKFRVRRVELENPDECCFEISADNLADCDLEGYKMMLTTNGTGSVSALTGVTMTSGGANYQFHTTGNFWRRGTDKPFAKVCIPVGTSSYPIVLRVLKSANNQNCKMQTTTLSCTEDDCCDAIEVTVNSLTTDDLENGHLCCRVMGTTICCQPKVIVKLKPVPGCPEIRGIGVYKDGNLINGIGVDGSLFAEDGYEIPCSFFGFSISNSTYVLKFSDENDSIVCEKNVVIPGCGNGGPAGKQGENTKEASSTSSHFECRIDPNPAKDIINLSINNQQEPIHIYVDIYDILGNRVRNIYSGTMKTNENNYTIDIANLPTGQYLIKVKSEIGLQSIPFVKQ